MLRHKVTRDMDLSGFEKSMVKNVTRCVQATFKN